MQKWEYKFIRSSRPFWASEKNWTIHMENELETFGKEGWELVAVSPRSGWPGITTEEVWIFKRPIEG